MQDRGSKAGCHASDAGKGGWEQSRGAYPPKPHPGSNLQRRGWPPDSAAARPKYGMIKHLPLGLALLASSFLTWCALRVARDELERSARLIKRLDQIVDDYHQGNLTLCGALRFLGDRFDEVAKRLPPEVPS